MDDDAALLTLAQWLSPAFPVGGFAWSHGLEAAVISGGVRDAGGVEAWIGAIIARGSGRADAVLLTAAMAPDADTDALADLARALAASRERWEETVAQGAAFAGTVRALTGLDVPTAALPVAVGAAAQSLGLPRGQVAAFYLQAFAGNLVSAAVRFVPLGQTEGQRLLANLRPLILEVARAAAETDPENIISSTPGADLAAMAHEVQDVRIFRS
jgi:urease accessory protein